MQKFRPGKNKKRETETGGKEKKGGREVGRIQRNLASSSPNTGHMLTSLPSHTIFNPSMPPSHSSLPLPPLLHLLWW